MTDSSPIAASDLPPILRAVELLQRIADAAEANRAEALDPSGAAKFLDLSVSKIHDLNARGLMPAPAQIGDSDRLPRWPRCELRAWLLAGCPSRQRWQAMRPVELKKSGGGF